MPVQFDGPSRSFLIESLPSSVLTAAVTIGFEACRSETAAHCRTRELSVRRKLNAMPAVFEGKNVLLVDDSIVRGTTMSQIVEMVSCCSELSTPSQLSGHL